MLSWIFVVFVGLIIVILLRRRHMKGSVKQAMENEGEYDEKHNENLRNIENCVLNGNGFSTDSKELYDFCGRIFQSRSKWVEVCINDSTTMKDLFESLKRQVDIFEKKDFESDGSFQQIFDVLGANQVVLGIKVLSAPETLVKFYYVVRGAQQNRKLKCAVYCASELSGDSAEMVINLPCLALKG